MNANLSAFQVYQQVSLWEFADEPLRNESSAERAGNHPQIIFATNLCGYSNRAIRRRSLHARLRIRPLVVGLASFALFACVSAHAQTYSATNVGGNVGGLPDAGASVVRVFGALILVIALFFAGVWMFRNWQRFAVKKGGGAKLNLIEVKSLGQRQALYVVGYQQQRMLLASSSAGITLVSHLPAAEETAPEAEVATTSSKMSFAQAFQQVLSRTKP